MGLCIKHSSFLMEVNMEEKKKIPCRVCGKLFKPCAYCQSHADTFRWRNFACSIGCATKYINDAIAYRESSKNKEESIIEKVEEEIIDVAIDETTTTRKKSKKKNSMYFENEIENKETE